MPGFQFLPLPRIAFLHSLADGPKVRLFFQGPLRCDQFRRVGVGRQTMDDHGRRQERKELGDDSRVCLAVQTAICPGLVKPVEGRTLYDV